MPTIKFTIEDFTMLDVPDNLLNLWSYNNLNKHSKSYDICKIYSDFCEKVLQDQWNVDWGDFKFVMEKIKNSDKTFIDISKFSSMNRWEIIDILIKKNKENKK